MLTLVKWCFDGNACSEKRGHIQKWRGQQRTCNPLYNASLGKRLWCSHHGLSWASTAQHHRSQEPCFPCFFAIFTLWVQMLYISSGEPELAGGLDPYNLFLWASFDKWLELPTGGSLDGTMTSGDLFSSAPVVWFVSTTHNQVYMYPHPWYQVVRLIWKASLIKV